MLFVERSVRASVGGTPSRRIVRVSAMPSRSDAAAGMGLVQLAGQRLELGFGFQRGLGVVGLAHPLLGDRAELVRQLVPYVGDLVLLTAAKASVLGLRSPGFGIFFGADPARSLDGGVNAVGRSSMASTVSRIAI